METRSAEQEIDSTLFVCLYGKVKMSKLSKVHIGQMVKSVFDRSGMTVAEFARQINCERTNIYTIFRRRTIDVELLVLISDALNHNFLDDIMRLSGLTPKFSPTINLSISIDGCTSDEAEQIMKKLENIVATPVVSKNLSRKE